MSGEGAPRAGALEGAARLRVAVVAASWHVEVMDGLVEGARAALADAGVRDVTEVRVPGTVELGVAAARLAPRVDAVVALGVVVRGGTPHFEYVCQSATQALTEVAVRTGTPVGFGVLTVDTVEQALDRAGLPGSREDKGREAVEAALATALVLDDVAPSSGAGAAHRSTPSATVAGAHA
ncbi:6,7-dimethyl-8-ribityllumazine synthase [Pseudokineococcus basanitobsidens]|uniref:6,7-dimethyl-8-ribityllumazine synthase n=1 Tax=Pseudokineococcus basanitobsidens TaxID=1926649 RepID=A0ABU8RLA6_9ACTN